MFQGQSEEVDLDKIVGRFKWISIEDPGLVNTTRHLHGTYARRNLRGPRLFSANRRNKTRFSFAHKISFKIANTLFFSITIYTNYYF